jgi:hypothetical protein
MATTDDDKPDTLEDTVDTLDSIASAAEMSYNSANMARFQVVHDCDAVERVDPANGRREVAAMSQDLAEAMYLLAGVRGRAQRLSGTVRDAVTAHDPNGSA